MVPGVSAVFAAAAALNAELTVPEVAQTVVLTRLPSRTHHPRAGAATGDGGPRRHDRPLPDASASSSGPSSELIAGGYPADTPAAVLHRVSWEDETIIRGTLADIAASSRAAGLTRQALILVGRAIDPELRRVAAASRSNLYDPSWSHVFRLAEGRGRTQDRLRWATPECAQRLVDTRLPSSRVTRRGARLGASIAAALGADASLHVSRALAG